MPHRLAPLLRPASIAVVGATRRPGTVGNTVMRNLRTGKFGGPLFAVNPGYADVEGVPCFPSLADLPQPVEQVIFAVADTRIEAALEAGIEHGMRTCVIYSALVLEHDSDPPLKERIRSRLVKAGILACGGNGMGYYNFVDGIWACGFDTREHRRGGNVALLSQSGSGMSGILDVDDRIDFNLAVSPGQELCVTLEDFLDYAIEQPETRVIGLFLETSRAPEKLRVALEKAARRRIPVVAIKTGRTGLSAQLALSHSGAMAGTDAVYDALFERYGVQRVYDMHDLATTLIMFAQPYPVAAGGVVTIHDSGGERQLLIDLAEREGTPLTRLQPETVTALEGMLDPGLPAVNPLDAWSVGGAGYHQVMEHCFATLLSDHGAALGAVVHDRGPHGSIYPGYVQYLRHGNRQSGKPVFLVAATPGIGADPLVLATTREGFPVLDGVSSFLRGARCLLAYRDFLQRPAAATPEPPAECAQKWRRRLLSGPVPTEAEAMEFLRDLGIPAVASRFCNGRDAVVRAVSQMQFPLVLKTASPGIAHKTDVGGVHLSLHGIDAVLEAYDDLAGRLGPCVTVAPMVPDYGVEMIVGMKVDAQFGPVIVMGCGGVEAEIRGDFITVIPPVDATEAARQIERLAMRRLLDGYRGSPRVDSGAFCELVARFSQLACEFGDLIQEMDLNPVLVTEHGCMALDAFVVRTVPGGELRGNGTCVN